MKIIVNRADGGCSVITPAPELFDPTSRTYQLLSSQGVSLATEADVLQHVITRNGLVNNTFQIVNDSDILSDRTFREAWTYQNTKLDVDMVKAKEIHLNRLRAQRDQKLNALDIATIKAVGAGNAQKTAEVEAQKQALRDMPITASLEMGTINTPEQLKTYIPGVLL